MDRSWNARGPIFGRARTKPPDLFQILASTAEGSFACKRRAPLVSCVGIYSAAHSSAPLSLLRLQTNFEASLSLSFLSFFSNKCLLVQVLHHPSPSPMLLRVLNTVRGVTASAPHAVSHQLVLDCILCGAPSPKRPRQRAPSINHRLLLICPSTT